MEHLRLTLPELEDRYEVVMHDWEGERSNYIVIGDVLQPRFVQEVESGKLMDFLHPCVLLRSSGLPPNLELILPS